MSGHLMAEMSFYISYTSRDIGPVRIDGEDRGPEWLLKQVAQHRLAHAGRLLRGANHGDNPGVKNRIQRARSPGRRGFTPSSSGKVAISSIRLLFIVLEMLPHNESYHPQKIRDVR
jgi:hypothetical protein